MDFLEVTEEWKRKYPGASAGVLVMRGVANPPRHEALDAMKTELEQELRERYREADRAAIRALGPVKAYNDYYKRFRKTYHVQLQLESLAFKGRPIPQVAALVEAMFMAELKNLLLTAGHDMDSIASSLRLGVSDGTEQYVTMGSETQEMKADDMMFVDGEGILSSIIYGPDRRTRITNKTRNVVFTIYGVPGIEAERIREHLLDIQRYVQVVAPESRVELLQLVCAQG